MLVNFAVANVVDDENASPHFYAYRSTALAKVWMA